MPLTKHVLKCACCKKTIATQMLPDDEGYENPDYDICAECEPQVNPDTSAPLPALRPKHGGIRAGAGRPKGSKSKNVSALARRIPVGVRLPKWLVFKLDLRVATRTETIERALIEYLDVTPPE